MEEVRIDVIKPVTIRIVVSGRARREDGNYNIQWFDNTIKVISTQEFQYVVMDFMQALREVTTLYQLNSKSILSLSLKTI
jgi:hypothetical protein